MFVVASILLMLGPPCVAYAWATRTFPWLARRPWLVIAPLVAFVAIQPVTHGIAVATHWPAAEALHLGVMLAGTALAMTSLPLGLLVAVSWAVGRSRRRREIEADDLVCGRSAADGLVCGRSAADGARGMSRRQVVEASVGAALFGATGAAIGWGMARGRHEYRLVEIPVRIPGLPRTLDGYTILQVSDIHAGTFVGERELAEGLAVARRARSDLVVVTGDIVDFDPAYAPIVARALGDLRTRDGIYACLGNHDYYTGRAVVADALRACGIETLVNDGRVIRAADGGGFALLGVDDLSARRYGGSAPDLRAALAAVPGGLPRILLSHQPPTVDRWAGQVALQLSGHTHGGQINPGGVLMSPFFEYVAGAYAVQGTTLYVNRGFGTVGPPARIGVPPEVARIVLVAA
jgi:predicted MPP superfamily phosphohydrolase